ncbi:MAG TPA: DUF4870 domain-containing protein [Dongiaceae bacterium]|nr:DUF4870 domain-containing protein [Dongiaceae bacterium]
MSTAPIALPQPTADECSNAMLVHILATFSGFIAPLIFFLVKKDSRFVKFHSLQVLIWHAAYMILFMLGMAIMFVVIFAEIAKSSGSHNGAGGPPPPAFFGIFGVVWLFGFGGGILNLVLGIVYAVKANRGEWARYPFIGDLVLHKILPEQPLS